MASRPGEAPPRLRECEPHTWTAAHHRLGPPPPRAPGRRELVLGYLRGSETRLVRDLGVTGCAVAACNDHEVLFSLLYLIVRCLLGVPAVLLRRDLSKDAELLRNDQNLWMVLGEVTWVGAPSRG